MVAPPISTRQKPPHGLDWEFPRPMQDVDVLAEVPAEQHVVRRDAHRAESHIEIQLQAVLFGERTGTAMGYITRAKATFISS